MPLAMNAEQRWSSDSVWLLGRLPEELAMEVRGVNADVGWTRFSSDHRSLQSRAVICSHSSAKHWRFAAELTCFHALVATLRWDHAAGLLGWLLTCLRAATFCRRASCTPGSDSQGDDVGRTCLVPTTSMQVSVVACSSCAYTESMVA